jgi:hypothetical protein
MQTGSSGTLIGWKSGKITYFHLRDRMEGAWLWTLPWDSDMSDIPTALLTCKHILVYFCPLCCLTCNFKQQQGARNRRETPQQQGPKQQKRCQQQQRYPLTAGDPSNSRDLSNSRGPQQQQGTPATAGTPGQAGTQQKDTNNSKNLVNSRVDSKRHIPTVP